jgi:hypothetical protein
VKAIVNMGASLQMTTVAEGIEDDGQAAALEQLGCDVGQGYLFARPVPPGSSRTRSNPMSGTSSPSLACDAEQTSAIDRAVRQRKLSIAKRCRIRKTAATSSQYHPVDPPGHSEARSLSCDRTFVGSYRMGDGARACRAVSRLGRTRSAFGRYDPPPGIIRPLVP